MLRKLYLLLNPDKATNNPGDSKESLVARKAYLNQGYYNPISDRLNELIQKYKPEAKQILDLGCGEGYYTQRIKANFEDATVYGLDISKEAINMATKYRKDIYWLVGNTKNVPVETDSQDIISALFTVVNKDELERCLKQDGYIIHVTANPYHLVEIKELIYDEVKVKSDEKMIIGYISRKDATISDIGKKYIEEIEIANRKQNSEYNKKQNEAKELEINIV